MAREAPGRDGDLSRRTLAEVRELRERRTREAREKHERFVKWHRKNGSLVVDDDGNTVAGPAVRIERIDRIG